MVRLAAGETPMIYVVLDGGRPIGQVIEPAGQPVLAPGAGTVLLQRRPSTQLRLPSAS
jgi:hypothetical protein